MSTLVQSALAPTSSQIYAKGWSQFHGFCIEHLAFAPSLPVSPQPLARYVAFLFQQGYAPATIRSRISPISYFHKLHALPDPSSSFFMTKLLQGCANLRPRADPRLPITRDILHRLIISLPVVHQESWILQTTLKSMFLLAFHAFLRLGELTVPSISAVGPHTLTRRQISFMGNPPSELTISFSSYKHSDSSVPTVLHITGRTPASLCPVKALLDYLSLVQIQPGQPLFKYKNTPISRALFNSSLSRILDFVGLDTKLYKSHSFRIGAATTAAAEGIPDQTIKAWGRWSSDAYKRYIRIVSFPS